MKLIRTLALTIIVLASALVAAPAQASTTYTPNGGPGVNFVGTGIALTVVQANHSIACPQFDMAGSVSSPGSSRPYGADALSISSLTAIGCLNSLNQPVTITSTGMWAIAITGAESGSTSPAQLNNVAATVAAAGCTFTIGGDVDGTFNDATQVFTPTSSTPSPLKISSNPVGFLCPILGVANGQDIDMSGTWTNTPPASSSPLTIANP